MGGMVLETNMNEIVAQVEVQNRMEKSEVSLVTFVRDHAGVFHPYNLRDCPFVPLLQTQLGCQGKMLAIYITRSQCCISSFCMKNVSV